MSRLAMIIDMDRCVGCGACVTACQEEWQLPPGIARNWVRPLLPEARPGGPIYTHYVGLCNHCERATCLTACPTGATYRDDRGRVRVDPAACIGCGYCVDACPYGARTLRKDAGRVEKCDFCAAAPEGQEPACVAACPADARIFGDLDDRRSAVSKHFRRHPVRRLETRQVRIRPRVFYAGRREVVDRILERHPPDPRRQVPPLEGRVLGRGLRPALLGLLILSAVGQLAVLLRRWNQRNPPDDASAGQAAEPTLHRHDAAVRWLHWLNALVWLFMGLTGLGLLGRSAYRITPPAYSDVMLGLFGSPGALLKAHVTVGMIWVASLVLFGIFGFRRHLLPWLGHLRPRSGDLTWIWRKFQNLLLGRQLTLPPQSKYNAGQKFFGLAVALGTVLIVASGLALYLLPASGPPIRWAVPVHFGAMALVLVGLTVHVFMAAILPSERPVFRSMFTGRITERYAQENNQLWWTSQTMGRPAVDAPPAWNRPERAARPAPDDDRPTTEKSGGE